MRAQLPSLATMDLVAAVIRNEGGHNENDSGHGNPSHGDASPETGDASQVASGQHGGAGGEVHAMSPFLFTRSTEFFVLFEGAFINSTGGFIGALILSFVFAIIATVVSQVIRLHENIALAKGSVPFCMIASVLHGFRQFLHYTAMLIVMTMNVWLIIAVVVGHALGWFIYSLALHNRFKSRMDETSLDAKASNVACDC